jgi:hypothetical protein
MTLGALGGEFHRVGQADLGSLKMELPWHNESSSCYVARYSQINGSY